MLAVSVFGQTGPYAPFGLRQLIHAQDKGTPWRLALAVEGRLRPINQALHRYFQGEPRALPSGENFKDLAVAADIPTLQTCDVNHLEVARLLRDHAIDVIVCLGFDRLFAPHLLASAKWGGINAHPSRLPKLRGPTPIFWALKDGAKSLTLTIHRLDAKEDHGLIYLQEDFVLPSRSSGDAIYEIAGNLAGRMMAQTLSRIASGTLVGVPQDDKQATRAPRPKAEDAFVEPEQWPCERLVNFASGAPFFCTPWMKLGDEPFFLRRGLRAEPGRRIPGQYIQQGNELVVQCQDGIAYLEIQV